MECRFGPAGGPRQDDLSKQSVKKAKRPGIRWAFLLFKPKIIPASFKGLPMQSTRLGNTGLKVSRLCLGCMSFGEPKRGNHEWTLNQEQSLPLIRQALEAGINFWDTANVYSD